MLMRFNIRAALLLQDPRRCKQDAGFQVMLLRYITESRRVEMLRAFGGAV
jgi:hypothetical protein